MKKILNLQGICVLSGVITSFFVNHNRNSFYQFTIDIIVMIFFGNAIPLFVFLVSIVLKKRISASNYTEIGCTVLGIIMFFLLIPKFIL
jgi:hypothetical protein